MEVTIYRSHTEPLIRQGLFQDLLHILPIKLRDRALRYRSEPSAYNYVVGRLLLKKGLACYGFDDDLEKLAYQENGKPIVTGINFNISHSGHQVICGFSVEGRLGIDLEEIRSIDFEDFTSMFSVNEWASIKGADDQLRAFYWFWTRKESIIKALGLTLQYLHDIELDVTLDYFEVDGKRWFLRHIEVGQNFVGALCCEEEIGEVQVINIQFEP